MKRYYENVSDEYESKFFSNDYTGRIFTGVQFKDRGYQNVKSTKKHYSLYPDENDDEYEVISESDVCGTKTNTASKWISLGGPIKGSYAVKNGQDANNFDFISDFGMRVEDPCQAKDNKLSINFASTNTTVKDLKYHLGTDSEFWLTQCILSKALRFVKYFPSIELFQGNLAITDTPPDQCTRLELHHSAPDNSPITTVFHLHMVNKFEAKVEKCSPSQGSCQPNIKDLTLKSTAGQSKTVTLFQQDSL